MTTMAVTHPGFPRLPRVDAEVVRQLVRYGVVGALGTAVSALLYLVFRIWWDAVPANLAALVLSTVLSTEANRRFTFDGAAADRAREYLQNAGTVAFYAVYGSVVLLLLEQVVVDPTALQESLAVARRERRRRAGPLRAAAQLGVRRAGRARAAGVRHSGGVTRFRRLLVLLAALAGLLLATAGACDTGAAPSAPPATVAPTAESPDDSDDSGGSEDGGRQRRRRAADDGGSARRSPSPRDRDDGGPLRAGNTGESR